MTFRSTLLAAVVLCLLSTSAIAQENSTRSIRSYGLGLPMDQVFLRASVDGIVQTIHAKEGQMVAKGDVIVEMDCKTAKARLKIARLEAEATGMLQSARAELAAAEAYFRRYQTLKNNNAASGQEFSDSKLRLERAKASLKIETEKQVTNQARYELALAEFEKCLLRAPFSGQITQVRVNRGAAVSESVDLVEIVALDSFRVELFIPVVEANSLVVGETVQVKIGDPFNRVADAKVVFRSPVIESATGTMRVVLTVENQEMKLPSGLVISLEKKPNTFSTASTTKATALSH